ncbi:hypothetical protein Tco_0757999 [Tanacetum coccineum]
MENTNPSSPPKSPNSFMNIKICELNALLESLNLTTPPLERDFFYLEGGVRFVELFKEYEIGDLSEGEIEEEEVMEVEKVAFEKHWKEIHVTWAQLAKKRDEDTTLQDFDGAMELIVYGYGVANPFDVVSA